MPGRLTLPARLRLRRKRDFDAAHARGRRMGDGFFAVTVSVNQAGAPRLGLAVAVRAAGGAKAPEAWRRARRSRVHTGAAAALEGQALGSASPPRALPNKIVLTGRFYPLHIACFGQL